MGKLLEVFAKFGATKTGSMILKLGVALFVWVLILAIYL